MRNITLRDLTAVASFREIAAAFGAKSHSNVSYWLSQGDDIPAKIRMDYADKKLPNNSRDAQNLYRRCLKHLRENHE